MPQIVRMALVCFRLSGRWGRRSGKSISAWNFDSSLTASSPLLGGSLARPHERFPSLFGARFWQEYPYFLPCVATSGVVLVISLITLIMLQEVTF